MKYSLVFLSIIGIITLHGMEESLSELKNVLGTLNQELLRPVIAQEWFIQLAPKDPYDWKVKELFKQITSATGSNRQRDIDNKQIDLMKGARPTLVGFDNYPGPNLLNLIKDEYSQNPSYQIQSLQLASIESIPGEDLILHLKAYKNENNSKKLVTKEMFAAFLESVIEKAKIAGIVKKDLTLNALFPDYYLDDLTIAIPNQDGDIESKDIEQLQAFVTESNKKESYFIVQKFYDDYIPLKMFVGLKKNY